jgi:hypothetical protein
MRQPGQVPPPIYPDGKNPNMNQRDFIPVDQTNPE